MKFYEKIPISKIKFDCVDTKFEKKNKIAWFWEYGT